MCTPLALLGFAVSAVSGVMQYQGQKAEYKAAAAAKKANDEAAQQAAVDRLASQELRRDQEEESAAQKKQEARIEGLKARSTARTAAGEAGVTGLSVDALLQDLTAQEGRYEASVDNNLKITDGYLRGEMKSTQHEAVARINSVATPTKPSFGSTLVNIFSSGVKAYGSTIT